LASSDVPYDQAYFARLDASGSLIGSEVKASFAGTTDEDHCLNPVLAWSGSGYAVAWADARYGYTDLYTTLLNGDGTIANGGLSHDILIESPVAGQVNPAMAWSSVSGRYILVWQDYRFGDTDLWGASLMPTGAVGDYHPSLVGGGGWPCNPSLVDTGNGLGFTWTDHRDGTEGEIYFARLSAYGARIGGETRLTSDIGRSGGPIIVWTGVEFGVFWHDDRGGSYDLWFQRVSASGTPLGINAQVTFTAGTQFSGAAFASRGYLASGAADGFANFVQAWGCNAPYFAPPCPENLLAYNITGSSATVSWLPAVDPIFDIAYYLVYRNNGLMGMTTDNYFTDTGLSPNVTYQYAIRAVNAAQAQSSSCGTASSIYVKTNATLSLILEKNANGTDADLSWSDAGLNNYNVFRGVSPQVMQQIGATSEQTYTDPHVLVNANIYFYTVDDPGG
jgi:hypothetical protein